MSLAKDEVRRIIDILPEQATWDDGMYQIYVNRKIEISLNVFDESKVTPHEEVVRKLLSK